MPALTATKGLLPISYKAMAPEPIASTSFIFFIGISLKLSSKSLDFPPVTAICEIWLTLILIESKIYDMNLSFTSIVGKLWK